VAGEGDQQSLVTVLRNDIFDANRSQLTEQRVTVESVSKPAVRQKQGMKLQTLWGLASRSRRVFKQS
jgi:hypothetical protein